MSLFDLIKEAEEQKEAQIKAAQANSGSNTNPPKKSRFDSRQFER